MDPLTALGLAGNVVQFVQFAAELLNSTQRIYHSTSGTSHGSNRLDDIYLKLFEFSGKFQVQKGDENDIPDRDNSFAVSQHHDALLELMSACKDECDTLLKILHKLQTNNQANNRRWWQSFRQALAEVSKKGVIEGLTSRLDKLQLTMVTHLCAISNENITEIRIQIRDLRSETNIWHAKRSVKLDQMWSTLKQINKRILEIRTQSRLEAHELTNSSLSPSDFELLTTRVASLSLNSRQYAKEVDILASLDFERRPARHDAIPQAYQETFQWILEPALGDKTTFSRWLQTGDGVFWISGKPGAGKSTLMKYIAGDTRTQSALFEWADKKPLVLTSHYFWSPGTLIQRSQEGLLRTLLHDVFETLPDIMPIVCSRRWSDTSTPGLRKRPWSQEELSSTLKDIASQQRYQARFCFFIDGLDEYGGDHIDMCAMLLALAQSPNFKLCVASRPWNVFEDTFGLRPENKLYIHDLTRQDIFKYSKMRLQEHPRWKTISNREQLSHTLPSEITDKAQGVFLWVFLVTRQLREGLSNGDSVSDLWARLESIPADLEKFFKQILEKVDEFYRMKMAETLCIALEAGRALRPEIYSFQDLEYQEEGYALWKSPPSAFNLPELRAQALRQLNGRCKGLLEERSGCIEFLHRTVRDFLSTGEMAEFLAKRCRSISCAALSLLRASVFDIKFGSSISLTVGSTCIDSSSPFTQELKFILGYAQGTERYGYVDQVKQLLDELDSALDPWRLQNDEAFGQKREIFRALLLLEGPEKYLSYNMRNRKSSFSFLGSSICSVMGLHISDFAGLGVKMWSRSRVHVLKGVIERGESPNVRLNSMIIEPDATPWSEFMKLILPVVELSPKKDHRSIDPIESFRSAIEHGAISTLLNHGDADPDALAPFSSSTWDSDRRRMPVWTRYLASAFMHPELYVLEERYMENLNMMIARGADITALLWNWHGSDTLWNTIQRWIDNIPGRRCTCNTSTDTCPSWDEKRPDGICKTRDFDALCEGFILNVIERLAAWDTDSVLPWNSLDESLRRVFHSEPLEPVWKALYQDGKVEEYSMPGGSKRVRRYDPEESSQENKKPRVNKK